jgi:nucleoside-diphosphate-sugar epimerase
VRVPVEFAAARPGELQASALVADKADRLLAWRPAVSLADGLRATYDFITRGASVA